MGLLDWNALRDFAQGASNAAASTVSGPVDLLSAGLRGVGLGGVIGPAPVGGSAWMAQNGLTARPQNQLAGLLGESAGNALPFAAAAKAPQIANGLLAMQRNSAVPGSSLNLQRGGVLMGKDLETIFRGESVHNRGGNFYTPDREFARNFTQSGLDTEIKQARIPKAQIYEPPTPVYAGDESAMTAALEQAKRGGFKAVRLSEGDGQPMSVFVLDKSALK